MGPPKKAELNMLQSGGMVAFLRALLLSRRTGGQNFFSCNVADVSFNWSFFHCQFWPCFLSLFFTRCFFFRICLARKFQTIKDWWHVLFQILANFWKMALQNKGTKSETETGSGSPSRAPEKTHKNIGSSQLSHENYLKCREQYG